MLALIGKPTSQSSREGRLLGVSLNSDQFFQPHDDRVVLPLSPEWRLLEGEHQRLNLIPAPKAGFQAQVSK